MQMGLRLREYKQKNSELRKFANKKRDKKDNHSSLYGSCGQK